MTEICVLCEVKRIDSSREFQLKTYDLVNAHISRHYYDDVRVYHKLLKIHN